ncbi:hypothetical protein [Leclercia tamurae]|uniref:hypothetical protein n=1 Tax=Leclercia tamurae TaxID=2926467 RepID=UPI0036F48FCC
MKDYLIQTQASGFTNCADAHAVETAGDKMQFIKEQCGICAECVPQIDGGSGFTNCVDAHAAETAGDKMHFTKEQLTRIIESADDVIQALAGTHEEIHPDSKKMIEAWDYLNDRTAPPEVVKRLAQMVLAGLVQPELKPAPTVIIPTIWKHYSGGKVASLYEQAMTEAGVKWLDA